MKVPILPGKYKFIFITMVDGTYAASLTAEIENIGEISYLCYHSMCDVLFK